MSIHAINAKQNGFILPLFLITTMLLAIVIITMSGSTRVDYGISSRETQKVNAQLAADAGLDKALIDLTANSLWTGSGSEVAVINDTNMRTTYQTTVTNGATATKKTITSVARTYVPATSTTPKVTRKYDMDVEAVTSGTGPSSVVSGVGGLILNANAKISGGDVVVNGKITLANNSQIGLSTNPVNVRAAHQSCPIPATSSFPIVCGLGNGEPISLGNTSRIYGNVQATNQTTGTNMSNPGLIAGATFSPITMPAYDRNAHKSAVSITKTPAQVGACSNNGSVTWDANLKITGNVTTGNNCTITIKGNVWITGNVNISNNAKIVVDNALGTTRPVVMVDGATGFVLGNNGSVLPNTSGTGIQVVTYYSTDSCSPDCADVTGTALFNSQSIKTIDLSNNGSAQNSVFYSRWTKVTVSNNGGLGAVSGQTIELSNNAIISFTASVPGSNNLITTWVKRGYMREYN